jgi:twinkle protein
MNVVDFPDQPKRFGYYALKDLPQQKPVSERAFGTGWWELDEKFKFYLGQFVVVTGMAGHGKSTFVLNILANIAREKGIRTAMYCPENEGNMVDKMRQIWRATGRNEASFQHYAEFQCFVVPSGETEEARTIEWVLTELMHAVTQDCCDIVLVDPWNELDRMKPKDQLLTDYIGYCIGIMKDFCRRLNVVLIIVAHPTKAVTEHGGRTPTLSDIEGSMNWHNKADNGLIVVREEGNRCRVISAKVRETGAGELGTVHFIVDPKTGLFTPQYGAVGP